MRVAIALAILLAGCSSPFASEIQFEDEMADAATEQGRDYGSMTEEERDELEDEVLDSLE